MYYLYVITPLLGLLKNYSKYKKIDIWLFCRTPILYFLLEWYLYQFRWINIQFIVIVFERWIMFLFKIIRSFIRKDYYINKDKYIKKYKLCYDS